MESLGKRVRVVARQTVVDRLRGGRLLELAASRRARLTAYSQYGEDIHLLSFYDRLAHDLDIRVERGLVVDVGAYRPMVLSNTYGFYKAGWRCINIDPTPGSKKLFDRVRPRDLNMELAIGPVEGEATFFVFGQPSVWNTMDPEAARSAEEKTGTRPRRLPLLVKRLETVLDEHAGDWTFEVLSIDAEGLDVEIIESMNLARHRPRVVLVEAHQLGLAGLASHPVTQLMLASGYHVHSWLNPNLMFVREVSALP